MHVAEGRSSLATRCDDLFTLLLHEGWKLQESWYRTRLLRLANPAKRASTKSALRLTEIIRGLLAFAE